MSSPESGSRKRPDGKTLEWSLTDPGLMYHRGLVPFFLDWCKTSPDLHPSNVGNEKKISLIKLVAETCEPELLQ